MSEYEKLFLMEVFLDTVYISTASLDLDPTTKFKLKETCCMFQFLDYPPLILCEQDFSKSPAPRTSASEDVNLTFKSGKSCMFSISSALLPVVPSWFLVNVTILRKLEDNGNVSKLSIGRATIDVGESFANLVKASMADPDLPLVKTKQGTFDVVDDNKRKVGAITGLIRISCFGQLIVTQFQVGAKDDAFMFKGTEPKEVVEIPGDSSKMPKIQVDPNYVPPPPVEQPGDRVMDDVYDQAPPAYNYEDMYPQILEPPPPPPPQEEPGNYKEIVAEIRGHSLHIKVPMRSKKEKELCKKQLMDELEGPVCKFAPPLNLCDCDYPVPPEAVPRCPR